jgi:hypothetical protein
MRYFFVAVVFNAYAFVALASAGAPKGPVITFALLGDIFLGDTEVLHLSSELNAALQKSQFRFGNLEGPICDSESAKRECRGNQEGVGGGGGETSGHDDYSAGNRGDGRV